MAQLYTTTVMLQFYKEEIRKEDFTKKKSIIFSFLKL